LSHRPDSESSIRLEDDAKSSRRRDDSNANGPATPLQLSRLNLLGLLRLTGEDAAGEIPFAAADKLLAETSRKGLWMPKRAKMATEKPASDKSALNV
jgi:hypothetical protein